MISKVTILCLVLLSSLVYCCLYVGRRPKGYLPGPPTLPIIGNLHQLAKAGKEPHFLYQKWAKEYGPIYSLILGTQVQIVLSSDEAIKGLIETKGAISSSRPETYVGRHLLSRCARFFIEPYGQDWRMQRKVVHHALNAKKITEYTPYLDLENKCLLFEILQDSSDLLPKICRFSASFMCSIAFGFRWGRSDNAQLQEFSRLFAIFSNLFVASTSHLMDFYPFLRAIPPAFHPVGRLAMSIHKEQKAMYKLFYLTAKHAILNKPPSARACVSSSVLALQQTVDFPDDSATFLAAAFLEGGGDTTTNTLYGFIQAMLLYPAAQHAAHAEVDALCGDARWPSVSDLPQLPYIRACVKEILRWMPAVPLGVPHALLEATDFMGYHVPARASLLLNAWTIHHDAARFPDPDSFLPERYLGDDTSSSESSVQTDVKQRDHFAFGAGRRICPGMHIADRTLAVTIARLVWAFRVEPKVGVDGVVRLPEQGRLVGGISSRPRDFECVVEARNEKRAELVRRQWEEERKGLDADGQFLNKVV